VTRRHAFNRAQRGAAAGSRCCGRLRESWVNNAMATAFALFNQLTAVSFATVAR
jgi:hypothetical protein